MAFSSRENNSKTPWKLFQLVIHFLFYRQGVQESKVSILYAGSNLKIHLQVNYNIITM